MMKELMIDILGEYEPTQVFEFGEFGEVVSWIVPDGNAGVDWPWIFGAIAFLIVLYSFFRIIGMIFKK